MWGRTARVTFNSPNTLVVKTVSTSAADVSSTAPSRPRPALLTSTSIQRDRQDPFEETGVGGVPRLDLVQAARGRDDVRTGPQRVAGDRASQPASCSRDEPRRHRGGLLTPDEVNCTHST